MSRRNDPHVGTRGSRYGIIGPLAWGSSVLIMLAGCARAQAPASPIRLDFTDAATVSRWQPTHDVSAIEAHREGMRVSISGPDPYITGPSLDPPEGAPLWIRMKLRSETGGTLQVFYFTTHPTEERSARSPVPAKKWSEVALAVPPLSKGTRLRIDPPGTSGSCIIAWLSLETRVTPQLPRWTPPPPPPTASRMTIRSGDVTLAHGNRPSSFALSVKGYLMASGWSRVPIAYDNGTAIRWLDLASSSSASVRRQGSAIVAKSQMKDPDGAVWTWSQTFGPSQTPGTIKVTTSVSVSRARNVYFLPMLVVLPGHGSFGTARERGLLAGVEYLDPPDQSSSEADLRGEQAQRRVPDEIKLTFPLMVMQARKRYVALSWDRKPWLAAAFDTPDRAFGSRANAMALLFPGSDGTNRSEGSVLPYRPHPVEPAKPLTAIAYIVAGTGDSVLPAVQWYVRTKGLPPVPPTGMDRTAYARWAAGGWLDSKIREGARYRHAYWPGFQGFAPHPAADAALWMEWLAAVCQDQELAQRLHDQVSSVLDLTDPATRNYATVSHVKHLAQTLLFGDAARSADEARRRAQDALSRFEPDGTVIYRAPAGGTDYGTTHFEKHANGLTAPIVVTALENALFAGDRELIRQALERLDALDRYVNSAPRGAQTWEVPLHTPDILASAHLVRAYLLGYEITGKRRYLDMARHWAWTGVPFVYLVPPTDQPVGLYATTPVLGATNWIAPNWIGLPVQWCGLVYSAALYRLAQYDNPRLWKRLADGITASGIQQSWPSSDKDLQALLPDSFSFRSQTRNPVAINPGTVQANAIHLYGGPLVYDYRVFRDSGITVFAPAQLTVISEAAGALSFRVRGWSARPYFILINGIADHKVLVNGSAAREGDNLERDEEARRVVLKVTGSPEITIRR